MSAPGTASFRTPLLRHARVSDAMHPGLLTCSPETPLRDVARIMASNHVHCVIVIRPADRDAPRSWGAVTDLDLAGAIASGDVDRLAGELATADPLTISADAPLEHAARLMAERGATHVLVVTPASGRPAGVVSTLDLAGIAAWGEG
jgi:CBS domain-containing protein